MATTTQMPTQSAPIEKKSNWIVANWGLLLASFTLIVAIHGELEW